MDAPQVALLPDGRRLHLQHGPIDLVIEAFGDSEEVGAAYRQARARFQTVLGELVGELSDLRTPVGGITERWMPEGPTALRMMDAVWPHRDMFVTPMAAVAGAVADEVVTALVAGRGVEKAYVNNSGDIAVHLTPGQSLRLGIVGELFRPTIDGTAELTFEQPVRGVATSGWQGRSQSFGIADAVTVLAKSAAAADVAATLIANAVNVDHPAIERAPATDLDDQSDLGERLVTVGVGDLEHDAVDAALAAGFATAKDMQDTGLIAGAVMVLKKEMRATGTLPAALPATA
ncbi:MAG: ApbE superfamily uncharacterized protein (UPF0280 family) [Paracoccaceae bacterium]|jgi:ApbE superfamily uncharacterized protein (UPF0280 family)